MKIVSLDPYSFIMVPDEVTEKDVKNVYPRLYFRLLECKLDEDMTDTHSILGNEN